MGLGASLGLLSGLALAFEPGDLWYDDFRRFEEVDTRIEEIATDTEAVSVVEIGTSFEGRPIRGLQISNASDRPTVLVLGTQHAREWASPMVTMCIAEHLAFGDLDAPILDRLEFVIVPVVNPDGYVYSWDVDRLWRKNRRTGGGVDLNRNWGQMWGLGTAGASPGSEIYPGRGAFSEPETAAIAGFAQAREVVVFVDYHSPVNLVLIPFAFTSDPSPHEDQQWEWGESMASAITAVHGVGHDVTKPGIGNPSGGLAQDWFAADRDAISFTIELRGGPGSNGFELPADQIVDACQENWAGFVDLAQRASEAFGVDPPDPEGEGDSGSDTSDGHRTSGAGTDPSTTTSSMLPTTGGPQMSDTAGPGADTGASTGANAGATEPAAGCGCRSSTRGLEPQPRVPPGLGCVLFVAGLIRRRRS